MPNIKSQIKRMKQAEENRLRNKSVKTGLKSYIKKLEVAISSGDMDEAKNLLPIVISKIDKAASKGVIHKNTASRQKARLAKKVTEIKSLPQE